MAIDTREKRASAGAWFLDMLAPNPDSAISAADRLQISGLYSGIAAASPTQAVARPCRQYDVAEETRSLALDDEDRTITIAAETRTKTVSC
jgi:hypothetical protein